jgi:hypothetical protein
MTALKSSLTLPIGPPFGQTRQTGNRSGPAILPEQRDAPVSAPPACTTAAHRPTHRRRAKPAPDKGCDHPQKVR